MSVEIAEDGAVVSAGLAVDYATAYDWAVDYPEKITDLVKDTQAFVTVIANAEAGLPRDQVTSDLTCPWADTAEVRGCRCAVSGRSWTPGAGALCDGKMRYPDLR